MQVEKQSGEISRIWTTAVSVSRFRGENQQAWCNVWERKWWESRFNPILLPEQTTSCFTPCAPVRFVTHCRWGGRSCCVSHTPLGSWFLGTLYFRDHWDAFWSPAYFTNICTNWICSWGSSSTTYCTNILLMEGNTVTQSESGTHTHLNMVAPVLFRHAFLWKKWIWGNAVQGKKRGGKAITDEQAQFWKPSPSFTIKIS